MPKKLGTPEALAERLLAVRQGAPGITPEELDGFPATAQAAYRVQTLVTETLGPVGGFKTARKPGVEEQIAAPIYSRSIKPSPAVFTSAEIDRIGIELEIGFRINQPLPDPADPDFEELVRQRVSPVAVIEVCDTRLEVLDAATPLQKLADNQLNGGLVVGEPCDDWDTLDMSSVNTELVFGSQKVLSGPAAVPAGDAFKTLLGIARQLGNHCGGLQPSHFVITGSVNGLPFIERGVPVYARIEGLGELRVEFPL